MATQLIRLTLLDGDPEGLRVAAIAGRTTVVLACPWPNLKTLLSREESRRPGVYFLVGVPPAADDSSSPYEQAIYIGECDSLFERFSGRHHQLEAAEWSQIYLATTSEGTFNKAHARQAEHLLVQRAKDASRAQLLTKVTAAGKIDEGDLAFAVEFVTNVSILSQTLGLTVFRPSVSKPSAQNSEPLAESGGEKPVFAFAYTSSPIAAELVLDGAQYVIRKGSKARAADGGGLTASLKARREAARKSGILVSTDDPTLEEFTADYPTTSPSTAGSMVYGTACAGTIAWRHVETGLLLKDWLSKQTGANDD